MKDPDALKQENAAPPGRIATLSASILPGVPGPDLAFPHNDRLPALLRAALLRNPALRPPRLLPATG